MRIMQRKISDNSYTLVPPGISLSSASLQHGYVNTRNIRRCDNSLKHPESYFL
jgi:hypothetical protein